MNSLHLYATEPKYYTFTLSFPDRPPTSFKSSFRARDIGNGASLMYVNDPDLVIRVKHLALGLFAFIAIIPLLIIHSVDYLAKRLDGTAQSFDTPQHLFMYNMSLLRWNLVGLVFPQYGRMRFGDTERQEHILRANLPTLTIDLSHNESRGRRAIGRIFNDGTNVIRDPQGSYKYRAFCFQPICNLNSKTTQRAVYLMACSSIMNDAHVTAKQITYREDHPTYFQSFSWA